MKVQITSGRSRGIFAAALGSLGAVILAMAVRRIDLLSTAINRDALARLAYLHLEIDLRLVSDLKVDVFAGERLESTRLDRGVILTWIDSYNVVNTIAIRGGLPANAGALITKLHGSLRNDGAGRILDSTANFGGLRVHGKGIETEKQQEKADALHGVLCGSVEFDSPVSLCRLGASFFRKKFINSQSD